MRLETSDWSEKAPSLSSLSTSFRNVSVHLASVSHSDRNWRGDTHLYIQFMVSVWTSMGGLPSNVDIHVPLRMNHNHFGDPLTSSLNSIIKLNYFALRPNLNTRHSPSLSCT